MQYCCLILDKLYQGPTDAESILLRPLWTNVSFENRAHSRINWHLFAALQKTTEFDIFVALFANIGQIPTYFHFYTKWPLSIMFSRCRGVFRKMHALPYKDITFAITDNTRVISKPYFCYCFHTWLLLYLKAIPSGQNPWIIKNLFTRLFTWILNW